METIEIDEETFDKLCAAFQYNQHDTECYLDTREGCVVWFSSDAPPTDGKPDADDAEWVHEAYAEREEIWQDDKGRYLEVPPSDIRDACRDMEAFLDAEAGRRLTEKFASSSANRRTYQAFRRSLERDRQTLAKWRRFRRERVSSRIREWLQLQGYRLRIEGV